MWGKMKKAAFLVFLYVFLSVVLLPFLVTRFFEEREKEEPVRIEALYGGEGSAEAELEAYVAGVVAAEMPASFPLEALKAQAVAARTYQLREMQARGSRKVCYNVGQAYCTEAEQRKKWGKAYESCSEKVKRAVRETEGEIMVYGGEPILAAFHAQSRGKTEAAENVWKHSLPYLKSVDSKGDCSAPNHEAERRISAEELLNLLCRKGKPKQSVAEMSVSVKSRTAAGYVKEAEAGGLLFKGTELRALLGLRSADFTVSRQGNEFVFLTKGFGHGAGMSQYGAAFLAEQGKSYREILKHYYTGIGFRKAE